MQQFVRRVHLWVGLILAAVLIIEAVTGLILAEPGWFGQTKGRPPGLAAAQEQAPEAARQGAPRGGQQPGAAQGTFSLYSLAKGLHQGKVGGMNLGWVVDISAVGLVVLSLSGVYMAVPLLRARRRRR